METPSLTRFGSLVEPWLERAVLRPDEPALVLIEDNDSEQSVSVRELDERAASAAAALAARGVEPGEVVILALRHSVDLVASLWGTLYHGGVPSIFPYVAPKPNIEKLHQQLRMLVAQSEARAVITLPELRAGLAEVLAPLKCRVLSTDETRAERAPGGTGRPRTFPSGEQIAYLQYTSGTTGLQKGVLLSHRAILRCIQSLIRAFAVDSSDVIVNWLPLYHDYGLFAGLMLACLAGIPTVLISPFKWVRRPQSLLWAIHRHRGTLSWMPNSAYSHTVLNVPASDLTGLDLSSLRCLANAAEPIMFKTQEEFLKRFGPFGFREEALMTGYGMAENSLAITISPLGRRAPVDWIDPGALQSEGTARPAESGSSRSRAMVSSGSPVESVDVIIADDKGRVLPERGTGEILIRSESIFSGYHRRPDLTAEAFHDGWFKTGDLGYLAGGQLYVCGRKRDLIIQAGHNIHPEDVEAAAAAAPGLADGRVVAFGVLDEQLGTERIILVHDLNGPLGDAEKLNLEREIRRRVFEELGVTLGEVLLPEGKWIARTHNGKVARGACRSKYLAERAPGT